LRLKNGLKLKKQNGEDFKTKILCDYKDGSFANFFLHKVFHLLGQLRGLPNKGV
jgi:hypothetical protein